MRIDTLRIGLPCALLMMVGCSSSTGLTVDLGGGRCDAASFDEGVADVGRVPKQHRASGSICPMQRGPGLVCMVGSASTGNKCATDADCATGANGRCFSPNGPPPACGPASCSYDECKSDMDCPARVPCFCRQSAGSSAPNVCVVGGNCAVDADCGPRGYCSPGGFEGFCSTPMYFCHTANDTCIDDSDCTRVGAGPLRACNYDARLGGFA